MLLTNWLNTLTSRIRKRRVFRSRDRRDIRKRWQSIVNNQISTTEALEDRTLLTTFLVDDDFSGLTNGDAIADIDPVTGGDQAGVFGTHAFATIQAAVTAAASSGDLSDIIHIADGTYNENVTVGTSIEFIGAGTAATTVTGSGILFTVAADDVRFQDMTLQNATQGIRVNSVVDNLQVDNLSFEGIVSGTYGIEIHNSAVLTNLSVANSFFSGTGGTGIRMASTAVADGIHVNNTEFDGMKNAINEASNNTVTGGHLRDLQVTNSTFQNISDVSIYAEDMRDSNISGNDFFGNPAGDSERDIVLNNKYSANGMAFGNIQITNNSFSNSDRPAIQLDSRAEAITGAVTISDNTFDSDIGTLTYSWTRIDVNLNSSYSHAPVTINNNSITFTGSASAGSTGTSAISLSGGSDAITISGNTLTDNTTLVGYETTGIFIATDNAYSGAISPTAVIDISNNFISGFDAAIGLYDLQASTPGGLTTGAQVNVTNNSLAGNTAGVTSGTGEIVNASGNWWGSFDEGDVAGLMTVGVDFSSYLNSGTDTDGGTAGFQGNFNIVNVTALGDQTGPLSRIQEAIEAVNPGGTINIASGTYAGNVDATATGIDKSVKLVPGSSPGQVVINGDLKLDGNDIVDIEVNGTTAGTEYDQFVVNGDLALGGATLNLIDGHTPDVAESFILIENNGPNPVGGTFNGYPEGYVFTDFLGVGGLSAYLTYAGGDGNDVAIYTEIPAPVVDIPADGGADEYVMQIIGGNVVITEVGSGNVVSNTPLAALGGTLVINGEAGANDTLTIDMTGIDETTPLQIEFHGGTGGFDTLELVNGNLDSMEFLYLNASDGSIQLNDSGSNFISYTGLEPITSTVNATTVTLNYSGVDETITVTDAGGGQTTVNSTAGELTTFNNPTGTLTINAGGGTDIINVNSLTPGFAANLVINGEDGDDTVNINSVVTLGAGENLTVNAESASVANGATVTAAGIALNATTVDLDADLVGNVSGDAVTVNLPGSAGGADLQDAVDVAGLGGAINVAAGVYIFNGTLDLDQEVSIVGAGKDVVELRSAGAPSGNSDIAFEISVNNVSISGAQLGWEIHTGATDYRGYVVYTTADNTTLNDLLFGDNYRSAVVFEGADFLEVSDSIFEGKFGRGAIRDGDSGSGEHFLITRNEFREDHYRWGPIAIGPQGTFNDPNNHAFSGEISFNYFNNGLEAGSFQEEGDQNYTVVVTNRGMTADGLDILHNTFVWEDSATVNQIGNYAQAGAIYIDPSLAIAPGTVNISDNIIDGYSYEGPQPSTEPLWSPAGGVFGGALEFDGVDDFGLFQSALFDVGETGTLNFWVKMDDTSRRNQFFEGPDNSGFEFQYRDNSGGQFFGRAVGGGDYAIQNGSAANAGVWTNLQFTWDASVGEMRIYVDGTQVTYLGGFDQLLAGFTGANFTDTINGLMSVGRDPGDPSRNFDGMMDDIGWFNEVLDQTDRDSIRNTGVATLSADARLVAHWDFDQAAGDIAIDNKNGIEMLIVSDGVSPLGPEFRPGMGQFGGALEFDGLDDFATFQDATFDVGAEGTLSFWVNMDNTGKRNQMFAGPGDSGMEFQFRTNGGGQFYGRVLDNGDYVIEDGPSAGVAGTWTNIQYTWNSATSEMRIYINGVEVDGYLAGFTPTDVTGFDSLTFTDTINGLMNVGRDPGDSSRFFDGLMDDIAWFNEVLTPAEIAEIAGTSVGASSLNGDSRLVAYWNLDDAPGTAVVGGNGGTNIDLLIQAQPPLPPIEGFGIVAPAAATVVYNVFNDNDLDSNLVLDPTNSIGDPNFAFENDVLYTPSDSLEEKFAIGFGSPAAFGSSEFAIDVDTDTPHIGAFQDLTLFGSGDIFIAGSGADDLLEITFTDANTATFILTTDVGGAGETTTGPVVLTNINSLTFNGFDGDDIFRITHDGAFYADPAGGITFSGGTGGEDGDGDVLEILGGLATTVEHRFTNANDGSILFDGEGTATITYTGLEPILDTITATDRIFSFLGGAETITLSDDGDVGDSESTIDSGLGESVTFAHPSGTVTINTEAFGGSGADLVQINAVDANFTANLTVNAGNDDTLTTTTVDIGAGIADLNAGIVNINNVFTTTGSVDIDAETTIVFTPAGVIDAGASNIDLTVNNGNIALGQVTTTGDVTLTATAGVPFLGIISDINLGVNNITATNATLVSSGDVGFLDALEIAVTALEANAGGLLNVDNTGTLDIGFTGGINGVTVGAASTITSTGTMTVTEDITATGSGLIHVESSAGNVQMTSGTQIDGGSGDVEVVAANDIQLGLLTTSANVSVTATAGEITDNNAGSTNINAVNATLTAGTGAGVGDALETTITALEANTGAGLEVDDAGTLNIGFTGGIVGLTAGAPSRVTSSGTMTVTEGITASGGNLQLENTVDDFVLNASTTISNTGGFAIQVDSANDLTVNGTVQTAAGAITLRADNDLLLGSSSLVDTVVGTSTATVTLTADFDDNDSGVFSQDGGGTSLVNARDGVLNVTAEGNIEIADLRGATVQVDSEDGAILDNTSPGEAPLITATNAYLEAGTSVGTGDDINTAVTTLAGRSLNGQFRVSNTGTLTIGTVGGFPAGVVATNGSVTISTVDTVGADDDLTINTGVTVQSTTASVELNVGDDFTLTAGGTIQAASTIAINVDPSAGDLDLAGSTVDLLGNVIAAQTTISGGDDSDTFNILPTQDSPITVNGGDPTLPVVPGDVLNLDFSGLASPPVLTLGVDAGSGAFSFLAPDLEQPVNYSSIENVNTSVGGYHLVLNMFTSGFQDSSDDTIDATVDATDTDLLLDINGGNFFTGAVADILSFTTIGSTDNETLNINENANGVLPFFQGAAPATIPGSNGSHLNASAQTFLNAEFAGAAPFTVDDITIHYDGGLGTDTLNVNFTSDHNTGYFSDTDDGLGSGNIGAATTAGADIDLGLSFARLEGVGINGTATGGLRVDASSTPLTDNITISDDGTPADGISLIDGNMQFTDLLFSGFDDLQVVSGTGAETLDLIGLDSATTLTDVELDADDVNGTDTGNDTIRVRSTPVGTVTNVTVLGGLGNDLIQIFDAGNTVDNIFAAITVFGEDGTDTLTLDDSGDVTGDDTFEVTSTTIEGISSSPGTDVTFTDIDNLNVTGTAGNDTINVNLGASLDLNNVTINGSGGDDTFNLQNSTPAGVDTRLNGDAGLDDFIFLASNVLTGVIDGGADVDTIDYSSYTPAVHVILNAVGTTDGFRGTESTSILETVLSTGFDNIDNLIGSAGVDTLQGPDLSNYWGITSTDEGFIIADRTNLNSGRPTVAGDAIASGAEERLDFTSFQNLIGGSQDDRFDLSDGAGLTGTLDGDSGNDSLDYRDFTTGVTVNLFAGTATNIGSLLAGAGGGDDDNSIENVFGGDGNDNITGDNDNNILGDGLGSDNLDGGGFGAGGGIGAGGSGNGGNDVFLLEPGNAGSADVITDIHGNDTVDFRFASAGITFDVDIINEAQTVFGTSTVTLQQIQPEQPDTNPSFMENVVGSQFDDYIYIDPLSQDGNFPIDGPPVLRSADGQGGTDFLDFDSKGQEVIDTGFSLTADGVGTVQYLNFENVTPFEDNPAFIIDNGDPGFTFTGDWPWYTLSNTYLTTGAGFEDDFYVTDAETPFSTGPAQAYWEFFGLTPGEYRVSVTWPFSENPSAAQFKATDAPFTVYDGTRDEIGSTAIDHGTFDLNQQLEPDDYSADGTTWEILDTFTISSRTLTVMLTNLADGYITADAIRIERVSAGPEIDLVDVTDPMEPPAQIVDGEPDGIQFGPTELLTDAVRTFEITNSGSSDLTISNVLVPAGYETTLTDQVIGSGNTISFTITMGSDTFGDRSGIFSFETDDVDESTFNILLDGQVSNVIIIDDGDADFSATPGFINYPTLENLGSNGYEGDVTGAVPNDPGSTPAPGLETATWTFSGLTNGNYRVSTTWSQYFNRVEDAPYSLNGGSIIEVDQSVAPSSFVEDGVAWFDLSTSFNVTTGELVVTLTNEASNWVRDNWDLANGVIADAVRIEYLPEPDIEITVDGSVVDDDTGVVDFGSTLPGIPVIKEFTITNLSSTDSVDVMGLIEFPPGFSILPTSPFGTDTATVPLAAGASITFSIQFDGGTNGTTFGKVSFTTGDADENPYNFTVRGEAGPATVGINDTNFSTSGTWQEVNPENIGDPLFLYANELYQPGTGANAATWSFDVEPGRYQVVAHWNVDPGVTMNGSGAASNAPYTISDGVSPVTVYVNQQTSSNDFLDDGILWEYIGDPFVVSDPSSTLTVQLTDDADGIVYADQIRIYRVVDPVVKVEVDGGTVEDSGTVNFDDTIVGASVVKTFTVTNYGERNMALSPTINLPAGFSLISGFGSTNLAPGASTTFTLQMDASSAGSFEGMVSFGVDSSDANPFNFTVTGSAANSMIIDNGDLGYTTSGNWIPQSSTTIYDYYEDDQDVLASDNLPSTDTATWDFTNLAAGTYSISSHWGSHSNLSSNAQFLISGILGGDITVSLDQRYAADDFVDGSGVNWETLGTFQVAGGSDLTITLLDNGTPGKLAADAMRLEVLLPGSIAPEIEIEAGAVSLVDGVSSLDLGTAFHGESLFQTFTITNTGTDTLNLSSISLTSASVFGIPVSPDFTIYAGQSTTLQVEFNSTGTAGPVTSLLTINSNDSDEGSFEIDLSATMTATLIIDDGDTGFSSTGDFFATSWLAYYEWDTHQLNTGDTGTATWEFSGLNPGDNFNVYATWSAHGSLATNAEYSINAGGPIVVNQRVAPNDLNSDGANWELLGTVNVTAGGLISVTLSDNAADGRIRADAIRIERTGPLMAAAGVSTSNAPAITQSDLDSVRDAALSYWKSTGLSETQISLLESVSFVLADLPDAMLGAATTTTILIDVNAAGYGWFVDDTPFDNSEFSLDASGELVAGTGSAAYGQMDLLTVMLHEMGHTLGYDHDDDGDSLMSDALDASERHLPEIDDFFSGVADGDNPLLD